MNAFHSILIATDFEPEADAAVRIGASLARQLGASVHLLHVVSDPVLAVSTPELYGIDWQQLREDMIDHARCDLEAVAAGLQDICVTIEAVVGKAAETIAGRARELEADLIVMGTHARGGVGHLIIGSVAERVIRLATCPVMTVRTSGAVSVTNGESAVGERAREPHLSPATLLH